MEPSLSTDLRQKIWGFYRQNGRKFIWRTHITPYNILISEVMLQQTQTERVVSFFNRWTSLFPTIHDLARASLADVLTAWQGLGYNRRAQSLHKTAQIIVSQYDGVIPDDPLRLVELPGIGPNTAGSICAFAYNKPVVFIETNIRSVFIHEFFAHRSDKIHDRELLPLIEEYLDHDNAREWYYALMDYGVFIKKNSGNPNIKSSNYSRQSRFEGSNRQVRGAIIKILTIYKALQIDQIHLLVQRPPNKIDEQLERLLKEGIINRQEDLYYL